jgi:hypothetical protein
LQVRAGVQGCLLLGTLILCWCWRSWVWDGHNWLMVAHSCANMSLYPNSKWTV